MFHHLHVMPHAHMFIHESGLRAVWMESRAQTENLKQMLRSKVLPLYLYRFPLIADLSTFSTRPACVVGRAFRSFAGTRTGAQAAPGGKRSGPQTSPGQGLSVCLSRSLCPYVRFQGPSVCVSQLRSEHDEELLCLSQVRPRLIVSSVMSSLAHRLRVCRLFVFCCFMPQGIGAV